MNDLTCTIKDPDNFSNSLLVQYIDQTPGITIVEMTEEVRTSVDIIFVDADQSEANVPIEIVPSAQVIVVSSNKKHIHSLFRDQIADFVPKSELTYARFLESVKKSKKRMLNRDGNVKDKLARPEK